jgi:hypothetical protein
MPTISKELPNLLKMLEEPEQLELFGGSFSARDPSPGAGLCYSVCHQLADTMGRAYHLGQVQSDHLRESVLYLCSSDALPKSAWREYLVGAGLALNPLPTSTLSPFWPSDRVALASDWQVVAADFTQVWQAVTAAHNIAERLSHERSEQQDPRQHADEQADAT